MCDTVSLELRIKGIPRGQHGYCMQHRYVCSPNRHKLSDDQPTMSCIAAMLRWLLLGLQTYCGETQGNRKIAD